MNKRHFITLLLLLLLICFSVLTVSAEQEEKAALSITDQAGFLAFAESCRLDSFSQNLTVSLEADIDLSGTQFQGIPVFCGTFLGNGHTISGLLIQAAGSNMGLFRYLTDTAAVSDLNVSGSVAPAGSGANAGGIAGNNSGSIQSCSFSGSVLGTDSIGGIAGFVSSSGSIEACTVSGFISGNHFVGGIAGTNHGIIQNCTNTATINTDPQQSNDIELSDITIETLTGSESAVTITDVGGIAGISSGYIRYCTNSSNVGYPHIGYNIGGIAGSQAGYLADCRNTGSISGRKDVGGIVGQLEPAIALTYSTDTLQILSGQLNTLSSIAGNITNNLNSSVRGIREQLVLLQGQIFDAQQILSDLLPEEDTEEDIPNMDALTNAADRLQDNLSAIRGTLSDALSYAESAGNSLAQDLRSMTNIIDSMQQTIGSAPENLGGSVSDVSDEDTAEDLTAKIELCHNSGDIQADLNGGGIAGTVSMENDLDPEDDILLVGDLSLNFTGAYRAVISECENTAAVTVKKQYAGGITGLASLGLIRSCTNIGEMNCVNAVYAGGIAGYSDGYIRSCSVKTQLAAKKFVGGIAGYADTVSDCMAMVQVQADEKSGCILGDAKTISQLSGNFHMLIGHDTGAVDGISYQGIAQPLSQDNFLAVDDVADFFNPVTVKFIFDDGSEHIVALNAGDCLSPDQIPPLSPKDGYVLSWPEISEPLYFDTAVEAISEANLKVIQSNELRDNGLPIVLAEGTYTKDDPLKLTAFAEPPMAKAIEAWRFESDLTVIRYLPPSDINTDEITVLLCTADDQWQEAEHTVEGSYIVFSPKSSDTGFCIIPAEKKLSPWVMIICGISLVVLISVIAIIVYHRRSSKRVLPDDPSETAE